MPNIAAQTGRKRPASGQPITAKVSRIQTHIYINMAGTTPRNYCVSIFAVVSRYTVRWADLRMENFSGIQPVLFNWITAPLKIRTTNSPQSKVRLKKTLVCTPKLHTFMLLKKMDSYFIKNKFLIKLQQACLIQFCVILLSGDSKLFFKIEL